MSIENLVRHTTETNIKINKTKKFLMSRTNNLLGSLSKSIQKIEVLSKVLDIINQACLL